jgi:hypothetical protein
MYFSFLSFVFLYGVRGKLLTLPLIEGCISLFSYTRLFLRCGPHEGNVP